ncbi:protein of unknown function [Beijerinckiaceae bacterium RH AL1]|nr:protein of unknown function [Beijerinckiaceae bacterium RH CH11]VVB44588.1 protein of unknown function [Beijerinckiaceae bacterium RH AL8]VVC54392.1 protein of unknown function [Beijerinckiaceae bacterium RH AL1]
MLLNLRRSRLDRVKALCATGIAFLASSEVAARDAAVPKPRVDIVDRNHDHDYEPPGSGHLRLTKL